MDDDGKHGQWKQNQYDYDPVALTAARRRDADGGGEGGRTAASGWDPGRGGGGLVGRALSRGDGEMAARPPSGEAVMMVMVPSWRHAEAGAGGRGGPHVMSGPAPRGPFLARSQPVARVWDADG